MDFLARDFTCYKLRLPISGGVLVRDQLSAGHADVQREQQKYSGTAVGPIPTRHY
jgi:hypothetical protein